jgi:hypothetical protein
MMQILRSLQSNALQFYVRFSYNPKVLRISVIPGNCIPGSTRTYSNRLRG